MALQGGGISKHLIEVYGITGEFSVLKGSNEEPVKVKYFQTVASNRSNEESGNALELLEELKPMRERVSSEDMKDLRSLLQRDLSDIRIANDLVPYLQGKSSAVGFFPSILVALIPTEYLSGESNVTYPRPIEESNPDGSNKKYNYDNKWIVENYTLDTKIVSIGKLIVDPRKTDFIVLDGQHRANAFRYLAGAFKAATDESKIYSAFYQDCDDPVPKDFNAELPVTIVWFEGDEGDEGDEGGITPQLISRKLFVDVNTTAHKVSDNRNILLDDYELASVVTANFYSRLVKHGYKNDELSLLHAGFDCEGKNFPADYPNMTLFSPRTFHYMMSYFLLSKNRYLSLDHTISSEQYGNFGSDISRVKDLTNGEFTDLSMERLSIGGDSELFDKLDVIFDKYITEPIYKIISSITFLTPHFSACKMLDENIHRESDAATTSTWNSVFKGGEGLYNAFLTKNDNSGKLKTYESAVKTIDTNFSNYRNTTDAKYSEALNTFISQAGFTGFFMALMSCRQKDTWNDDMVGKFISTVNTYSVAEWIIILTEYKPIVIKELSPKLWPKMRAIFLRFIEVRADKWSWGFESEIIANYHPDYQFCINKVKRNIDNWRVEHENDDESRPKQDEEVKVWAQSSVELLKIVLGKVSVTLKNESQLESKIVDYIESKFELES
jgi:hypothetical protein